MVELGWVASRQWPRRGLTAAAMWPPGVGHSSARCATQATGCEVFVRRAQGNGAGLGTSGGPCGKHLAACALQLDGPWRTSRPCSGTLANVGLGRWGCWPGRVPVFLDQQEKWVVQSGDLTAGEVGAVAVGGQFGLLSGERTSALVVVC